MYTLVKNWGLTFVWLFMGVYLCALVWLAIETIAITMLRQIWRPHKGGRQCVHEAAFDAHWFATIRLRGRTILDYCIIWNGPYHLLVSLSFFAFPYSLLLIGYKIFMVPRKFFIAVVFIISVPPPLSHVVLVAPHSSLCILMYTLLHTTYINVYVDIH